MALTYSEKMYYNPKPFCSSFKDWEGNAINVYEQKVIIFSLFPRFFNFWRFLKIFKKI